MSLICQVLWQRELVLVMGGSVYSTTVILMVYMSGLALGNLMGARLLVSIGRETRLFALLQGATGAFILAFPLVIKGLEIMAHGLFTVSGAGSTFYLLGKAVIAFLALLVPTTLIGASFPVMVSLFERLGVSKAVYIGKLNFSNSLGSVFGALATGFFLIRHLGARHSMLLTGALFLLVGGLVVLISKPLSGPKRPAAQNPAPREMVPDTLDVDLPVNPRVLRTLVVVLFFFSGFTALSYELLYNRILVYFLGNTTFSFTLIVAFFILGYSLGSYLFVALMKKRKKLGAFINLFVLLQLGIALYHLFMPLVLPGFHRVMVQARGLLTAGGWSSLGAEFGIRIAAGACLLIPPALAFGMVFPLVYRLIFGTLPNAAGKKSTGRIFARINAVNTLGSVLGPLVTGFFLIGVFQVSLTLRITALINVVIGFVLLGVVVWRRPATRRARILKSTLVLLTWTFLIVLLPVQSRLGRDAARESASDVILYYREGVFGTVSVSVNRENVKMLKINGVGEVPTDHDSMRAFRMLAYLPVLAHENPRNLLSIAFGGGITFGSIANTAIPDIKCVEICNDVLNAAPLFHRENNRVVENERAAIVLGDGRHYVQSTPERFDIITSDATHPASFDSWVLYTREFYASCRKKLRSGGIMAQWVPLHGLSETDYRTVLKTFTSVFPHTSLYLANAYTILMGSEDPITLKPHRFRNWTRSGKNIVRELGRINIHSLPDLENCLLLRDRDLREFVAGSPVSTDAFSPLQFAELRSLKIESPVAVNLSALLAFRARKRMWNSGLDPYMKARILAERGEIPRALRYIDEIDPGNRNAELQTLERKILKEIAIRETRTLFRGQDTGEMEEKLRQMVDLFPEEGYFTGLLGYLYSRMGQPEKASVWINRAVELSPWNPAVAKIALNHFLSRKAYRRALAVLDTLMRMEPRNPSHRELQKTIRMRLEKQNRSPFR